MKLYGKNPVLERIKKRPSTVHKIYLQKRTDLSDLVRLIKDKGMSFESVDREWFETKCRGLHTQGVMAEIDDFLYTPFSEIMTDCLEGSIIPVFLDGITDPQNLGAIIRNISCLGGFSIVFPEHRSISVNETVLRIANGGENYIKISKVTNIATTIKKIKEAGALITGAVIEDSKNIIDCTLRQPMAIVIGSEGKGIRPGVIKCLDMRLSLPMEGAPISYNAAVAASLFCYEVKRHISWDDKS